MLRKQVNMFNSTSGVGGSCKLLINFKGVPSSLSLEIHFFVLSSPLLFNCSNLTSATWISPVFYPPSHCLSSKINKNFLIAISAYLVAPIGADAFGKRRFWRDPKKNQGHRGGYNFKKFMLFLHCDKCHSRKAKKCSAIDILWVKAKITEYTDINNRWGKRNPMRLLWSAW